MKRRALLAAMAGAASWPLPALTQPAARLYRVGIVTAQPRTQPHYVAFVEGLARAGFVEGKNLQMDWAGFSLKPEEFGPHAKQLIDAKVDVIFAGTGPSFGVVQKATSTIPIVTLADDMVGEGIVPSMARPGGNVTGVSLLGGELDGKRQELLLELLPDARRVAVLADQRVVLPGTLQAIEAAAKAQGIAVSIHKVSTPAEIAPAVEAAKEAGAQGLNVLASVLLFINRKVIFERTASLGLPAIYQWPEYVDEGALAGYGPRLTVLYRDLMVPLAVAILNGTKPADLPVRQPTTFQLAINLKTAKALGVTVPKPMLIRADDVVE